MFKWRTRLKVCDFLVWVICAMNLHIKHLHQRRKHCGADYTLGSHKYIYVAMVKM